MDFYALAYKYQEDVFFNVVKSESVMTLNEGCLFPSKEVAEAYREDELDDSFVVVSITLHTLSSDGNFSWSRSAVTEWD